MNLPILSDLFLPHIKIAPIMVKMIRPSSFCYMLMVLACTCLVTREYFIVEKDLNHFELNPSPKLKRLYHHDTSYEEDPQSNKNATRNKSFDENFGNMATKNSSNLVQALEINATKYHTGSFANCTGEITTKEITIDGTDSGTIIISCKPVKFRAKLESFHNNIGVIVGVLSSAGDPGPARRQSIRRTWASNRHAVFFLVAGPWEDIAQEYEEYGDLLWIDEEEVYDGERSVLTMKTYSFFSVSYAATQKYNHPYTHIFKTDDDSFLSMDALYHELRVEDLGFTRERKNTHDYFGQCQLKYPKVHREDEYKWPIREQTYPEPWFPRYCQGSGFGLSKKFLSCAVGHNHVANIRFMPFEDVAVGMLAERCGIVPEWPSTAKVKVFRYKSDEMKKRVRLGDKNTKDVVAPYACMANKIVQHRIIDEFDMEEHFKTMKDPTYCDVTRARRDKIVEEKRSKGIRFFD